MEKGKKELQNHRWEKKQTAVNSQNDRFTIYGQMEIKSGNSNSYSLQSQKAGSKEIAKLRDTLKYLEHNSNANININKQRANIDNDYQFSRSVQNSKYVEDKHSHQFHEADQLTMSDGRERISQVRNPKSDINEGIEEYMDTEELGKTDYSTKLQQMKYRLQQISMKQQRSKPTNNSHKYNNNNYKDYNNTYNNYRHNYAIDLVSPPMSQQSTTRNKSYTTFAQNNNHKNSNSNNNNVNNNKYEDEYRTKNIHNPSTNNNNSINKVRQQKSKSQKSLKKQKAQFSMNSDHGLIEGEKTKLSKQKNTVPLSNIIDEDQQLQHNIVSQVVQAQMGVHPNALSTSLPVSSIYKANYRSNYSNYVEDQNEQFQRQKQIDYAQRSKNQKGSRVDKQFTRSTYMKPNSSAIDSKNSVNAERAYAISSKKQQGADQKWRQKQKLQYYDLYPHYSQQLEMKIYKDEEHRVEEIREELAKMSKNMSMSSKHRYKQHKANNANELEIMEMEMQSRSMSQSWMRSKNKLTITNESNPATKRRQSVTNAHSLQVPSAPATKKYTAHRYFEDKTASYEGGRSVGQSKSKSKTKLINNISNNANRSANAGSQLLSHTQKDKKNIYKNEEKRISKDSNNANTKMDSKQSSMYQKHNKIYIQPKSSYLRNLTSRESVERNSKERSKKKSSTSVECREGSNNAKVHINNKINNTHNNNTNNNNNNSNNNININNNSNTINNRSKQSKTKQDTRMQYKIHRAVVNELIFGQDAGESAAHMQDSLSMMHMYSVSSDYTLKQTVLSKQMQVAQTVTLYKHRAAVTSMIIIDGTLYTAGNDMYIKYARIVHDTDTIDKIDDKSSSSKLCNQRMYRLPSRPSRMALMQSNMLVISCTNQLILFDTCSNQVMECIQMTGQYKLLQNGRQLYIATPSTLCLFRYNSADMLTNIQTLPDNRMARNWMMHATYPLAIFQDEQGTLNLMDLQNNTICSTFAISDTQKDDGTWVSQANINRRTVDYCWAHSKYHQNGDSQYQAVLAILTQQQQQQYAGTNIVNRLFEISIKKTNESRLHQISIREIQICGNDSTQVCYRSAIHNCLTLVRWHAGTYFIADKSGTLHIIKCKQQPMYELKGKEKSSATYKYKYQFASQLKDSQNDNNYKRKF